MEQLAEKAKIEEERPSESDISEPSIVCDKARVKTPEGKELVFESRVDLDEAIKEYSNQLSKCVAAKELRKDQSLEGFVDEMDALKPQLHSLTELLSFSHALINDDGQLVGFSFFQGWNVSRHRKQNDLLIQSLCQVL